MTFQEALKILNIEDYGERIMQSNSHGELFHLEQYIGLAEVAEKDPKFKDGFRYAFEETVKFANEKWERPQSVYQHILGIILGDY